MPTPDPSDRELDYEILQRLYGHTWRVSPSFGTRYLYRPGDAEHFREADMSEPIEQSPAMPVMLLANSGAWHAMGLIDKMSEFGYRCRAEGPGQDPITEALHPSRRFRWKVDFISRAGSDAYLGFGDSLQVAICRAVKNYLDTGAHSLH